VTDVPLLVDHLFRRSAGQMVATLARIFGVQHLDLAEEVVQEALLSALAQWPYAGIPDHPAAWLFQVARNKALDRLRRDARFRDKEPEVVEAFARRTAGGALFEDDDLQMMLLACDERIAPEARLALTLKTVCGFSVAEIARALLAQPSAIAQRLVRVKRFLREEAIDFAPPSRFELPRRLDSLLDVIYLMFNEGYALVRPELVGEAIHLAEELAAHPATSLPKTHALAALLHFQAARIPARVDGAGDFLLLDAQDRTKWDQGAIRRGVQHLDRAIAGDELSRFHAEAAIAAAHVLAPSFEATDWPRIVSLYDDLLAIAPTPVVALNRAVALSMTEGPGPALAIALPLPLDGYLPYHAAVGELALRSGDAALARAHFGRAAEVSATAAQQKYFAQRLAAAASHIR
jgi:RNA polymerase sigma-70 factor (ECF subfamily)